MELKYLCHFSQIGDVKECKGKEVIWYEECQLEGLKLETEGISISIFSKNIWSKWENNGEYLGTKGEKTPLAAIRMRPDTKEYDVFYRVSIKHIGWSAWSKNGEICGSESAHSIINGIQILTFLKNENLAQKLQEAECFLEKYKKIKANLFVRNKEKLLRACTRDYYLGEETTQIIEKGYILPLKKLNPSQEMGSM